MKALMNQIRLQKEIYLIGFGIMGGLFAFGTILHEIIIMADGAAGEVFCMGSMMSVAGIGAAMLFGVPAHMVNIFNYAISMGRTRRSFFPAYTVGIFFAAMVLETGAVLLHAAERARLRLMYPHLGIDDPAGSVLHWNILLPIALLATTVGVLCGTLIIKFGKMALWILWTLWVAVCIGMPRGIETLLEHPDNLMVQMVFCGVKWLYSLTAAGLAALAAAVCMILLAVSYLLLRRQQVNL
ncbi:hypothetical protein AALB53_01920 [Lachnospiraceae bacterium 47-T17]